MRGDNPLIDERKQDNVVADGQQTSHSIGIPQVNCLEVDFGGARGARGARGGTSSGDYSVSGDDSGAGGEGVHIDDKISAANDLANEQFMDVVATCAQRDSNTEVMCDVSM